LRQHPPTWGYRNNVRRGGISPPLAEGTRRDRPAQYSEAGPVGAPWPGHIVPGRQRQEQRGRVVVGRSCRQSQRDVEEAVGLFWIAVRLVEPLCAPVCASASASVALPTAGLHPRAASPQSTHLFQVAGGTRHPLASPPLVAVELLAEWTRDAEGEPKGSALHRLTCRCRRLDAASSARCSWRRCCPCRASPSSSS